MLSSSSLRTSNTKSRPPRVRLLLVIEAAAAATPPKTARFAAGARVCGEGWEVPVRLKAAEGIVPVGLVGVVAVRLPVGVASPLCPPPAPWPPWRSLYRLVTLSSRLDSRSGEESRDRFLDWMLCRRSESGRVLFRLSSRPIAILE
jgi:hypothetical protein